MSDGAGEHNVLNGEAAGRGAANVLNPPVATPVGNPGNPNPINLQPPVPVDVDRTKEYKLLKSEISDNMKFDGSGTREKFDRLIRDIQDITVMCDQVNETLSGGWNIKDILLK